MRQLIIILLLSLTACGDKDSNPNGAVGEVAIDPITFQHSAYGTTVETYRWTERPLDGRNWIRCQFSN